MATGTISSAADLALDDIDQQVTLMFAKVRTALASVTAAFLECDREAALALLADDQAVDGLQQAIEGSIRSRLAEPTPLDEAELSRLLSVLLVVAALERGGDVVARIASRTPQGLARVITAPVRTLVAEMSRVDVDLWARVAQAYNERDAAIASELELLHSQVARMGADLLAELGRTSPSTVVTVEMKSVVGCYQRLGDLAVDVAEEIRDGGWAA